MGIHMEIKPSVIVTLALFTLLNALQLSQQTALADSAATTITPSFDGVRWRKNIDDLSDDELKAYEHAVAMMKEKSQQNIYDREGFLWHAWVHNCNEVQVDKNRQVSLTLVRDLCDDECGSAETARNRGASTHSHLPADQAPPMLARSSRLEAGQERGIQ